METSLTLRKLINRRVAQQWLQALSAVLPGAYLALEDNDGRILVEINAAAAPSGQLERYPLRYGEYLYGALVVRHEQPPASALAGLINFALQSLLNLLVAALENRSLAQETLERYREINLLYNIGETINTSLDPQQIPGLVRDEATRIISADFGVVLLFEQQRGQGLRSSFGDEALVEEALSLLSSSIQAISQEGKPRIVTAEQFDHPAETKIASALVAPLKTRSRVLGVVLLGRCVGREVFTAGDEKLLTTLVAQAAIAVENARLFADLRQQRDEIAAMKTYMDNIFTSIASGVMTTDNADAITTLNRAAQEILHVEEAEVLGRPCAEVLPAVGPLLLPLMEEVKLNDRVVQKELNTELPGRGPVFLRLHLSQLKDNHAQRTGIAIVLDDLTETRRLEKRVELIEKTFKQYVVPSVVEQLLSNPDQVRLGGVRREITVLFADIRGFTAFSERTDPESLVEILNRYLTLAAEAVLNEEGTLDKFMGDAVMAIFNAPLEQRDHTLRAVRAALAIRESIRRLHEQLEPAYRLSFGIGITTGASVVGNIGSSEIRNYTAIGDSVNLAYRFQSHAGPGQIFLNEQAYRHVQPWVEAVERGPILVKGHKEPDVVYEVLGLRS